MSNDEGLLLRSHSASNAIQEDMDVMIDMVWIVRVYFKDGMIGLEGFGKKCTRLRGKTMAPV